ncbi:MAG TPA: hypothetical protein VD766_11595 [Solirubrobacterales bacterium]|nr:hypothetical protein [Solirubrobacterales bacterium]
MSEVPPASTPPPGSEELNEAGIPEGGLVADAPAAEHLPVHRSATRSKRLKALFTNVWVLSITWVLAIIALIAAGSSAGIGVGAAAGGAILLIALIVVFVIASNQAANDFYAAYAETRGLSRLGGKGSLPPVTPLLQRGDRRYTDEIFNGLLPGGLSGALALYTYEETSTDSKGNRQTTYYHFTVAVSQLPETAPFLSELAVQRRSGFRFMDKAEDVFRTRQRVEVESTVADKKFEIFTGKSDDMNRARQVFSPVFVAWLAEDAHENLAFELNAGAFVANSKGHLKTAEELDAFCEASALIARRLDEEACE